MFSRRVNYVSCSRDESILLWVHDHCATLWHVQSGERKSADEKLLPGIQQLGTVSCDGERFILRDTKGNTTIWDMNGNRKLFKGSSSYNRVNICAGSHGGHSILWT